MQLGKTGIYVFYPPPIGGVCSNTVVIDGREKVIVDPGLRELWSILEKNIVEETQIKPGDFSLVIHTHAHPDHMDAGALLEEKYGVTQAMSQEEADFLDGEGRHLFGWMGLDEPAGTIGRILEEGPLELDDKVLQLYLTPGHSPGSLCIHLPEQKVLITGDLIFAGGFGRLDLGGGDPKALTESIKRMAALEPVDIIIPGHGPSIVGRGQIEKNYEEIFRTLTQGGFM
ncbi:MAG: MBL fold metallo-hydrolase [Deltaproteobacteria bacterium]|jgi:glyoxylase-like metal-dependent hydrolase (beta-lactamase superfamily II)|nr:MBL fold metallo-hydrolase [Deltaproteobacteria bacterium]